jgi:ABC-type multidrug transport system ATPase subunit
MTATQLETPLVIRELCKSYGTHPVLNRLNFSLAKSAIHGLVGLNGSGKTTTLECILGMQRFNSGSITVLDHPPGDLFKTAGRVVGIFDTPSLHPNLTVRQCLEHARLLCGRVVRSFTEVEALLGIERYRDFKIRHLSLGNRRRASIAQALLGNPELIILDEPFNGLDAEGVEDVLALVKNFNHQFGMAFLLSSHQLPYLERICSHLAILHEGRIAISDSIESLFKRQQSRLMIRCDQAGAAQKLIENSGLAVFESLDSDQQLHFRLTGDHSAEINRQLVMSGIAVSELVQQRNSLTSLFHEVTGLRKEEA